MLRLSKRLALLLAICVPFVFLSLLSLYHLANGSDSEHTINLPFNQPLRGNVPVNIRKPEAKQIGQSARDDSTLYRPDGCPVPRNHSGLDWKYYSALPEHNFKLASRALELTDKPIIHEKQGNGNGVSIPRRLIFTHYVNLIDCDIWRSANVTLSPQLYNLQQNVHHTINAYKTVWGDDLEVVFLKDNDCVEAIKMIESGLVGWFHALDGMYKADLCRAAYLYLHGGYYFDVDILVVRPYIASATTKFVTVKGDGWPHNGFFQAFLASTKGHPIVGNSVMRMVERLWKNDRRYLGPMSLMDAWKNLTDVNDVYLLAEVNLKESNSIKRHAKLKELFETSKYQLTQHVPEVFEGSCQFSSGACNVIVVDDADETVFFYSRLIGTTWCGKQLDCIGSKHENEVAAKLPNEEEVVVSPSLSSTSRSKQSTHSTDLQSKDVVWKNPSHQHNSLDDLPSINHASAQQPPDQDLWLVSQTNPVQHSNGRIPRIINKIYFAKDGQFPSQISKAIKQAHQTWSSLNPGYQVRYFNLVSARRYLRKHFHPVFLRAFDCIEAFAGKSDLFRMALLYREGGFHTDWKTVCLQQNLLERIGNSTHFFAALDYGGGFVKKSRSCAANAFVGATPNHPIAALYLEYVLKNVQSSLYGAYVLMTTGPCVLGRAILTHDKKFGNDTVSWPIHLPGYIHWKGEESEAIVATKCKGCGEGQDWEDGNNYMTLWLNKRYYCEDSASIFHDIDIDMPTLTNNNIDFPAIYPTHALENPHHKTAIVSFSWRSCFTSGLVEDIHKPAECRESPSAFERAPPVGHGWIPDVEAIRTMLMSGKDRFPPPLDNELCEDINEYGGRENDTNKECFREAIVKPTGLLNSTTVTINPSNHFGIGDTAKSESVTLPSPRLMCLIYTISSAHSSRIRAMRETWAGGCDGFLAFSTESDPRLPAIALPHDGPEEYTNMWQKVRSIWRFVGEHYLDAFDWFFIGGDDLYVLPHNLKTYLASLAYKDKADPKLREYFVGRRFKIGRKSLYFNSGGAGYALSHATLRKFLNVLDDVEHCSARKLTAEEDVEMASCLKYLGINVTDTRDANGRERFHPFSPGTHFKWTYGNPDYTWYQIYNKEWGLKTGKDCCAPDSVSFHYVKSASMVRHLHALLYSCDTDDKDSNKVRRR